MAKWSLNDVYNSTGYGGDDNHRAMVAALRAKIVESKGELHALALEELFGFSGGAAQFVIKAAVVQAAHGRDSATVERLLGHLEGYSWNSFDCSLVGGDRVADAVFSLVWQMASVLLGKDR